MRFLFFSFLAALIVLFQLLYAMGKPQQIQGSKIRSFAQLPCKSITRIFVARKVLQLYLLRNGKTSTSRSQLGLFWLTDVLQGMLQGALLGKGWRVAEQCFHYVFGLGDSGRTAFTLMFTLCFRHIILVVCVRLCD